MPSLDQFTRSNGVLAPRSRRGKKPNPARPVPEQLTLDLDTDMEFTPTEQLDRGHGTNGTSKKDSMSLNDDDRSISSRVRSDSLDYDAAGDGSLPDLTRSKAESTRLRKQLRQAKQQLRRLVEESKKEYAMMQSVS